MHSTPSAKLLWSNRSNPGTTLAASGNSGNTPIDLRYVNSLWLAVSVTAATGTNPILDVYLDLQDAAGNWLTQILHATPQLTGAGSASGSGRPASTVGHRPYTRRAARVRPHLLDRRRHRHPDLHRHGRLAVRPLTHTARPPPGPHPH